MSNYYNNNHNNEPSPGPGPYTQAPGPQPPKQNDWVDVASWIVDVGLICTPVCTLGVILTIMKNRGRDVVGDLIRSIREKNRMSAAEQYARTTTGRAAAGKTPQYTQAAAARAAEQRRAQAQKQAQAQAEKQTAKEKGVRRADAGAKAREVFGWILGAFGLLAAMGGVLNSYAVWTVLSYLAMALGGGLLIFSGRQGKKKEAAFRRCMTVSGDRGIVKLKPLAKTLGMTEEALEKQLSEMIDRGYYGARAYIDHARELLVIEPEQMRDIYRAEDEEKARQAERQSRDEQEAQKASQTEYERLVERIRQADIDIADEVMSEKIRQMQSITESIFQEVEEHPEKRPQIERFMNYYLPTTLKLLESYARIEEQGVSGENTAKAKADIERIADTLVEGYRKQLDTLYRTEAVDIAGDVSVIESMMRRDGLTGQGDFRPFRQFVEPDAQEKTALSGGEVLGGH